MSILGRLIPIARTLNHSICNTLFPKAHFNSLAQEATTSKIPGGIFNLWSRNLIICHFPRPSEVKRIKRHGYKKRMSTPEGRRIIMRKILKGRHVYSH